MLDEQVDLTYLLEKLYKTGKIDKKYTWALKHYVEKLNKENQCLKGILQEKYEKNYNNAKIVKIDTYKLRCEKAIEYIENNFDFQEIRTLGINYEGTYEKSLKVVDLLNILEGEK